MITKAEIEFLANEIAAVYGPEKIYLFGSYAHDTAGPDSDLDLLIIKRTEEKFNLRSTVLRSLLNFYPGVPLDLIVYTPEEFDALKTNIVSLSKEAVNNGKLLYERA
jgi:predicted nucleotidyltransferase